MYVGQRTTFKSWFSLFTLWRRLPAFLLWANRPPGFPSRHRRGIQMHRAPAFHLGSGHGTWLVSQACTASPSAHWFIFTTSSFLLLKFMSFFLCLGFIRISWYVGMWLSLNLEAVWPWFPYRVMKVWDHTGLHGNFQANLGYILNIWIPTLLLQIFQPHIHTHICMYTIYIYIYKYNINMYTQIHICIHTCIFV